MEAEEAIEGEGEEVRGVEGEAETAVVAFVAVVAMGAGVMAGPMADIEEVAKFFLPTLFS